MQTLAEGFLKKQLAKTPFTVKTILDLVSFLKLNGQSRDTASIIKTIQDLYSSEFLKEHLNKLPAESKGRLDRFMANSLDDFVELSHDPTPARFFGALFSCIPVLCGQNAVAVVASVQAEIKEVQKVMDDLEKVKVVVDTQLNELSKEIQEEQDKLAEKTTERRASAGLVLREMTAPATSESAQPVTESSVLPATSGSETTTDVSGSVVVTTPESIQDPKSA